MTVGPVPTTWYPEQQKLTAAGHVKGRVTASSAQCASLLFQVQVVMTWAFMTVPDLQGRPDLTTYCTTSLPKKNTMNSGACPLVFVVRSAFLPP